MTLSGLAYASTTEVGVSGDLEGSGNGERMGAPLSTAWFPVGSDTRCFSP